jgi:hypothetical protein
MSKRLLQVLLAALAVSLASRAEAAAVSQTSCEKFQVNPASYRSHFSVVNTDSPVIMHVVVLPPIGSFATLCRVIGQQHPVGWTGTVRTDGGVTFDASSFLEGIFAGFVKSGFAIETHRSPFCCYRIQFRGFSNELIETRDQCFSCLPPTDAGEQNPYPWGFVKGFYR